MIKYSYKKLVASASIVAVLLSFTSCGFSEAGEKMESLLTIELKIPESVPVDKESETRNGTGVEDNTDNNIGSVLFVIFDHVTGNQEVYEYVNDVNASPMWDPQTSTLRIPVTAGTKDVYCVANIGSYSELGLPTNMHTLSRSAFKTVIRDLENYTRIKIGQHVLMTGASEDFNIAPGMQKVQISMTRQIARIEIYPMISEELKAMNVQVELSSWKWFNYAKKSYLFPQPTIPVIADRIPGNVNWTTLQSGLITATDKNSAVRLSEMHYVPEISATQANGTWTVFMADYNGEQTYYTLKLGDSSFTSNPSHPPYVVERNHTYRYYITIKGKGSDNPPTTRSYSADKSNENISCEIEVVEIK